MQDMKREHMDQEIKNALYSQALRYQVPRKEQSAIMEHIRKAAMREHKEEHLMKSKHVKRAIVLAAAAVALIGTVCMAAGKAKIFYSSGSPANASGNFSDLAKYEDQTQVSTNAVESFSNGYQFTEINIQHEENCDEEGRVLQKYESIQITYEKDGDRLTYFASPVLKDIQEGAAEILEEDGQTYYYHELINKFVPTDYEPTEEELAQVEAGMLNIGYGSDKEEVKISGSIYWQKDGCTYSLFGFDTGMAAQEFLQMAQEIVLRGE